MKLWTMDLVCRWDQANWIQSANRPDFMEDRVSLGNEINYISRLIIQRQRGSSSLGPLELSLYQIRAIINTAMLWNALTIIDNWFDRAVLLKELCSTMIILGGISIKFNRYSAGFWIPFSTVPNTASINCDVFVMGNDSPNLRVLSSPCFMSAFNPVAV